MWIALRRVNNRIRHVPPLVPFSTSNPCDSWSTHTKECHNSLSRQSLGNVLEKFIHTKLQEGQPLTTYLVQVRALAQSLEPRISQPFLIKWSHIRLCQRHYKQKSDRKFTQESF